MGVGLGKDVLDEHIEKICWKFLTNIGTPQELIDPMLVKKVLFPYPVILLLLEKSWCVGQCQCILLFHLNDVTGSHFYL